MVNDYANIKAPLRMTFFHRQDGLENKFFAEF